MGVAVTEGLGAGSQPEVGRAAAEEAIDEIIDHLSGSHMVFVTAGMGGGTGTGAAPIIARAARDQGILTVGVVTKPFQFEGARRMRVAEPGIKELQACVDTLIVIPNQNLFRIANEKTTFADAFAMADQVLYSGVACITDLMVKEGLINLDFADVRSVMREMGKAMMGTGEASGDRRAIQAAEAAIANPLLDETSMKGAKGLLISITGGKDLTLFEVDEAATRIREEVDPDANIILGATFEEALEGVIRVSVVATGIDNEAREDSTPAEMRMAELSQRLRTATRPEDKPAAATRPAMPRRSARSPRRRPRRSRFRPPRLTAAELDYAQRRRGPGPEAGRRREAGAGRADEARDPDVTIAPYKPAAAAYDDDFDVEMELRAAFEQDQAVHAEAPFIPPQAEAPPVRMPKVEDFPPIAQRQMEAHHGGQQPEEDRGPMSLLAPPRQCRPRPPRGRGRAAAAGSAPAAAAAGPAAAQPQRPKLAAPPPPPQRQPQQQVAAPPPPQSDYAKRPPAPRRRPAAAGLPAAAGRTRPAWPAAAARRPADRRRTGDSGLPPPPGELKRPKQMP